MVSKEQEVFDSYNATRVSFIVFLHMRQDGDLDECLLDQLFRLLHYLYRQ